MGFQLADASHVYEVRKCLLGLGEAERLTCESAPFLFPAEDLLETRTDGFFIVEHPGRVPESSDRQTLRPYFQLVLDGILSFEEYLVAEANFVQVTRVLWELAGGTCTVQVSYNLSPTAKRNIPKYFGAVDADHAKRLLRHLGSESHNIIRVDDVETVELLMKLGLRELAMSTFAFPPIGICLINHWDMRLIAYVANPPTGDLVRRSVANSNLSSRSLDT